jgi:hypothetical protein
MSSDASEAPKPGVLGGFQSWAHLLRFCTAATFIVVLCALVVWAIVARIGPGQKLSISFNKEGSTLIFVDEEPSKALVLVSAGTLWQDTGIKVRPGQKLNIGATGLVNLAIHRLVEAADRDKKPRHGWVGPDGDQQKNEKPVDRIRKRLRIEPREGVGCLLAYVRAEGEPNPGKENPKPAGVQVVRRNGKITYEDNRGREGTLFLVVNEAVVQDTPEAEAAYVTTPEALDETYGKNVLTVRQLQERWGQLVKENYWELWFNDNVGQFLVQISYEAKPDS